MADEPFGADDPIMSMLTQGAGQLGALIGEAMRPEIFAYELVGWDRVNVLAADGWQVQGAIPLVPDFPHGIAFVMCRKRGPADEAAEMLSQGVPITAVLGADGRDSGKTIIGDGEAR